MRRSFTWHAGLSLGCGTVFIALGLCAGRSSGGWLAEAGWLVGAGFGLMFVAFLAALARGVRAGAGRAALWASFRCLPRGARLGCAGLVLAGALVSGTAFAGDLQDARPEPGGHSALDTRTKDRVRVPRERYEEVRAAERRGFLALPGTLLAASGTLVLALGEWHGAGRAAGVGRTRAPANGRGTP